jgi:hypothetical protein
MKKAYIVVFSIILFALLSVVLLGKGSGETAKTIGEKWNSPRLASVFTPVDLGEAATRLKNAIGNTGTEQSMPPAWPAAAGKAMECAKNGDAALAAAYWHNALEHASNEQLLAMLGQYAHFILESAKAGWDVSAEVGMLERMTELAVVRVPADAVSTAVELRDAGVAFAQAYFGRMAEEDETGGEEIDGQIEEAAIITEAIESVERLLEELRRTVVGYNPSANEAAIEAEYKILQLVGITESSMSQLWLLNRDALTAGQRASLDGFPKRLADVIGTFNETHDNPIVEEIKGLAAAIPPESTVSAKHQANISFYTNQSARVAELAERLRGENSRLDASKAQAAILSKVTDEKRLQFNAYQQFVANCCQLAWNGWEAVDTGKGELKRGLAYNGQALTNVALFVDSVVRDVSREMVPGKVDEKGGVSGNGLLDDALETKWFKKFAEITGLSILTSINPSLGLSVASSALFTHIILTEKDKKENRGTMSVSKSEKAFITLALCGFFRIDQSLLAPETSRIFNEVFQKYHGRMEEAEQNKAILWMVGELPYKFRLEEF